MPSSSAPARSACSRCSSSACSKSRRTSIDSLAYAGGQCIELYPDKPIYDIPAVPVCTGKELTDNLLKQIEPFGATFHLGQEVNLVARRDDGRFDVATSKGTRFITKTIFIAGGVGSFQPRLLKVDGLEKFDGTQLHYRVRNPAQFAGKHRGDRRRRRLGAGLGAELRAGGAAQGRERDPGAPPRRLQGRAGQRGAACTSCARRCEMQFLVGQVTGIDERDGKLDRREGDRRRRRHARGAAGHAAGVLRPDARSSARSPTGA